MQETDLFSATTQGSWELKRHNINLGPSTRLVFDINSSLISCSAVMLLATPPDSRRSDSYEVVRASNSPIALPDTTLDNLWACTQEHYGLTAAAVLTGVAGIPINKTAVGAWVHSGSSKTTNLASYIGWKFFPRTLIRQPTAARMAKATFGTVRVFGIIGRGIPFVAAGLAVFDLLSIGLCAYEARNGKHNRDEVTEQVIQLFVDIIGFIERHEVTEQTDFIHDFKIIDDDLSCFVMQVQWQFRLRASQDDWEVVTTIKQVVDLIMRDAS